jgi:hypothetical protein
MPKIAARKKFFGTTKSRAAVREPPLLLIHANNGKLIYVSFMPGAHFIYIFPLRPLRALR